ncbi:unnamed protein product [Cochlearia groenlandica]
MTLKETKAMYFLIALTTALIFGVAEAVPYITICSTSRIERVSGCYDALKLVLDKDYRKITAECCRAVYATLPPTCFLPLLPERVLPMTTFRSICMTRFPPFASAPSF